MEELDYKTMRRPEEKPATNLLELLERILDKGVVIIGDIRISVADIELLKIQIRLLVASVDKAKDMGIDFSWAQKIEGSQTEKVKELESKIRDLEGRLKKPQGRHDASGQTGMSPESFKS